MGSWSLEVKSWYLQRDTTYNHFKDSKTWLDHTLPFSLELWLSPLERPSKCTSSKKSSHLCSIVCAKFSKEVIMEASGFKSLDTSVRITQRSEFCSNRSKLPTKQSRTLKVTRVTQLIDIPGWNVWHLILLSGVHGHLRNTLKCSKVTEWSSPENQFYSKNGGREEGMTFVWSQTWGYQVKECKICIKNIKLEALRNCRKLSGFEDAFSAFLGIGSVIV